MQVADEMLEFWGNFVGAVVTSGIREVKERFRPYLDRLVSCLCMLCKFDASTVSSLVTCLKSCLICAVTVPWFALQLATRSDFHSFFISFRP